jgi:hypothetical protein
MLKVLCGLLVSGNAATGDGEKVVHELPGDWLDVLMGRRRLPEGLGLSVTSQVGDPISLAHGIGFGPVFGDGGVPVGALASINGIGFALMLAKIRDRTGTPLEHAVYHPKEITYRGDWSRVILLLAGDGWNEDTGLQIAWSPTQSPSPA